MWQLLWDHMGLPSRRRDFCFKYRSPRTKKCDLVGGWPTPLKNMKVSWNDYSIIYIYIYIMENKKCLNHQPVMQWCNVLSFYMFAIPLHENVNPLEWKKGLNDVECWYLVTLKWYMLIGDTDIWQLTSLSVTHAGTFRHWNGTSPSTYQSHILAPQCGRHFPRANGYESKPWYPFGTLK